MMGLGGPARASQDPDTAPGVVLQPGTHWTDAATAVRFEIDQAGLRVRGADQPCPACLSLTLEGQSGDWTLCVFDSTGRERARHRGTESDPAWVGLVAVELLLAASEPVADPPEPSPPTPERPDRIAPDPSAQPTIRKTAPAAPSRPRTWVPEVSVGSSNIGIIGLGLGLRHRWRSAELGLALEGAYRGHQTVEIGGPDEVFAVNPGAVLRTRLVGAYAFRPGKRLRPSVGLACEFVVPFVDSEYRGDGADSVGATEASVDSVGALWVPAAELGLRLRLSAPVDLVVSGRIGPTVTLVAPELADGGTLELPPFFAGGTAGFAFGGPPRDR